MGIKRPLISRNNNVGIIRTYLFRQQMILRYIVFERLNDGLLDRLSVGATHNVGQLILFFKGTYVIVIKMTV